MNDNHSVNGVTQIRLVIKQQTNKLLPINIERIERNIIGSGWDCLAIIVMIITRSRVDNYIEIIDSGIKLISQ